MTSLLHARFPALEQTLPRLPLCRLPTPVRALPAIASEAAADADVWVKDDSLSSPLWGGNKPRKLEWILADAERRGRRTIITFGGLGTNHGLATALYARQLGMRCVLALVDQPVDDHVTAQLERIRASGARVHLTHSTVRTVAALPYLLLRYGQAQPPRFPYWLAPGGSSPVGSLGFVEAALELGEQIRSGELPKPETVVVTLGSGGTVAGLLLGLRLAGLDSRVLAVLVSDKLRLSDKVVLRLARRTERLLERRGALLPPLRLGPADVEVRDEWLGGGYGHRIPAGQHATELARRDGLELDPVYTAKTVAALLAGLRNRTLAGPVLYWHTQNAVAL